MTKTSKAMSKRSPLSILALAPVLMLMAACQTMPKEVSPPAPPDPAAAAEQAMAISTALHQAEGALSAGQYDLAQRQYLNILAVDSQNLEAQLGLGEILLAIGESSKAAGVFRGLREVDEVRARAVQGEGLALLAGGYRAEARDRLEAALSLDAALWRSWNALGQLNDSERNWADSARCYDEALGQKPDAAIVHNNKGFSLLLQGKYEAASGHLVRALELQPRLVAAQANLRLALAWQGRYVEAIGGLDRDDTARVLNNIGYVALLRGDYERSEALLTRAMESSPSYFEVASRNLQTLKVMKEGSEAPDAVPQN
jgi:Tfp pilus assembly protein PilF